MDAGGPSCSTSSPLIWHRWGQLLHPSYCPLWRSELHHDFVLKRRWRIKEGRCI